MAMGDVKSDVVDRKSLPVTWRGVTTMVEFEYRAHPAAGSRAFPDCCTLIGAAPLPDTDLVLRHVSSNCREAFRVELSGPEIFDPMEWTWFGKNVDGVSLNDALAKTESLLDEVLDWIDRNRPHGTSRPCSGCGKKLSGEVDASWCPTSCTCLGAPWCTECWNQHIDKKHEVAEHLFMCLWLYPNYEVGSRGPVGLLLDALDTLHPALAGKIREGEDLGELREKFFPDEDDELQDDGDDPLPESE